mmetsp:Transcript_16062/g.37873  ORF Transcript_16062/g.37873 Transcript_16062/m.37873 type:complete len:80 (-) Transcript_16062:1516-1755(-)
MAQMRPIGDGDPSPSVGIPSDPIVGLVEATGAAPAKPAVELPGKSCEAAKAADASVASLLVPSPGMSELSPPRPCNMEL